MQPVANISEVPRSSVIEKSLSLSNSWKQFGFNPEKYGRVVNSGIERLWVALSFMSHMSFYEIQNTVLLTPHLFFIQPQAPSMKKTADAKGLSRNCSSSNYGCCLVQVQYNPQGNPMFSVL